MEEERLYLTIARGPDPHNTRAVLVSSDQDMISSIVRTISSYMGAVSRGREEAFQGPSLLTYGPRPTTWRAGDAGSDQTPRRVDPDEEKEDDA